MSVVESEYARVTVVGQWALEAANDRDARFRTVRIFDLSRPEKNVPGTAGKLQGTFVRSYYLSTLLKHDGREVLHMGETRGVIPAADWPEIHGWLKFMSR